MNIKHLDKLKIVDFFKNDELPCIVREMHDAPSNAVIAMHDHEFSELVIVAAGSLNHIHTKGTIRLIAGDFFVIHPGERHGYAEMLPGTKVFNLLYHHNEQPPSLMLANLPLMAALFPQDTKAIHASILGHIQSAAMPHLVELIKSIQKEGKSRRILRHAICTHLFSTILLYLSRAMRTVPTVPTVSIQKEIDFITRNLNRKITLKELCTISGKSVSTLSRDFRKAVGKSPGDYIIAMRIAKARDLLSRTTLSLGEIATLLGFCSASHLTHTLATHQHHS